MPYRILQGDKAHIFGLTWEEQQSLIQHLTGIKAEYAKLGSDVFIYKKQLKNALDYIKWAR